MSEHKYECSALKHHVCSSIFSFLAATSRRPPSSGVDNLTAARGEKHACQPLNLSVCTKMQFFFFFHIFQRCHFALEEANGAAARSCCRLHPGTPGAPCVLSHSVPRFTPECQAECDDLSPPPPSNEHGFCVPPLLLS